MPLLNTGVVRRLLPAATAILAFALFPQLALAQAPGSLAELGCIQASNSGECPTDGKGLTGALDTAVSPDGRNVYVAAVNDDSIAEFTRKADGTLGQLDPPNDCIADPSNDGTSTCTDGADATGLVLPQAIAVSPDGQNVYAIAQDVNGNGTIAEFARASDGSLSPVSGHDCIAENIDATDETSPCDDQTGFGIARPFALAISPDGKNVYVVDEQNEDIAVFSRASDGSLSQLGGADDCIADASLEGTECGSRATGISEATSVVVTPHGENVYTAGFHGGNEDGTIAEFARNPTDGSLTQPDSPANCIQAPSDDDGCGTTAIGVVGFAGLVVSPDGQNVYTASQAVGGPIAEFSRAANGALSQLPAPNDCIQEGSDFGCSSTGIGITTGYRLAISPDGASVYAPSALCSTTSCEDVAEFARNADGTLTQLPSPDSCIQNSSVEGNECPGNEQGQGLGGPGVAVSPDGASVYVTGNDNNSIAAFARRPVNHTLTVSLGGSGSGAVSDGSGAIACPSTCSHAYTANSAVTLTATPSSGSTFAGWSGACSGTGTCQVIMSADTAVTAVFTATGPPAPGAPAPVLTAAPTAVTDSGAGFSGSVNPEGLPTTVFFQYGLDKRYSQVGASGPNYTAQTPVQSAGSDFTTHGVGPVTVSGLVPNALYHFRLVATNSAGTTFGQDVTFTTALAPLPGSPTLGQSFNVAPVSGLVLVLINGHLVPLTQLQQLPPGVTIDSLHGTFQLVTSTGGGGSAHDAAAKGKRAKTQTGKFGGAVVRLHQTKGGPNRGLTTIMMVESAFKGAPSQAICKAPAGDAHAAASKTIQLLHASAHGKFRTSGRYSAATVRGTSWTMRARCDGTLTHVITDSVVVTDFIRHKTIVLHAGQSYLAPNRRKH
jgi:DNA-binding beta-propeller fold protein YncE